MSTPTPEDIARAIKLLTFARELAWEAERQIPDKEGRRLKSILNSVRHSYLAPALKLLGVPAEPVRG